MASGLYTLPRRGQLSVTPHKRSAVWGGAMVGGRRHRGMRSQTYRLPNG